MEIYTLTKGSTLHLRLMRMGQEVRINLVFVFVPNWVQHMSDSAVFNRCVLLWSRILGNAADVNTVFYVTDYLVCLILPFSSDVYGNYSR